MDIKPHPNHVETLKALHAMTGEQRIKKAFEMTATAKRLFREGLKRAFPGLAPEQLHELYLKRLELCHNRNY